MSVTARIEMVGGPQLMAKLKELADAGDTKTAKKIVRKSVRAACHPILSAARSMAPLGKDGLLRRYIKIRAGGKNKPGIVAMTVGTGKGNNAVFYAHMLDYGTKARFTKLTGAFRGFLKPLLFLNNALTQNAGQATSIVRDELSSQLAAYWTR